MYEAIKKILNDGGKCLLIEDGKPIGVVLTMADYEKLLISGINSGGETKETNPTNKSLFSEANNKSVEPIALNPIGEAMAKEMDFPGTSAEIADLEAVDDVTLEDLGVDELPY